jgi:glycosyltransferase involved in cell wall biosynthesis
LLYNILILNYEYPPLGGGAGIITRHLANEFAVEGHKVTVLTTFFEGLKECETEGNLTIIRLPSRRKRLDHSNIREMYSYMNLADQYAKSHFIKGQFDVCIANFTLPGGYVAMNLKRNIDLPFVIISHGHDIPWFYPKQMFFLHVAFYAFIRKICRASDRLVLLTDEMKDIADSFMGSVHCDKNVIIPNGIHEKTFDYGEKPHDRMKILFVGRMVEQKDPLLFLDAMKQLKESGVDFEARMLGGGPLMKKVRRYKDEHNLDMVQIDGKVAHNIVIDRMMESHVLLAPSTHEAMSVTILEALSCGLYIITTPISGNKEIVKYNGALVDSRVAEDYLKELLFFYHTVYDKNEFERKPVPEALLQEFNWKVVAEKYLSLFNEILTGR